mgnify:FL=1
MKTKIINLFGGPGIGKSTQSSGLYYQMKKAGMSVELTSEFPKVVAWEQNHSAIKDQLFITANQHRNITRLYGQVEYIIIDSPILFGLVYKGKYGENTEYPNSFYGEAFDRFIMDLFTQYDSINILLKRNDAVYQEEGRFQDLEESRVIDKELKDMLSNNSIDYKEYIVNDDTVDDIFNYINTI